MLTLVSAPKRSEALQRVKLMSETEVYTVLVSNTQANRFVFPFRVEKITSSAPGLDVKFHRNTATVSLVGEEAAEMIVYAKGKSYMLNLIPKDIPGETVILEVQAPQPIKYQQGYLKAIKDLIMAGYRGEMPDGYQAVEVFKKVREWKKGGTLYLVRIYRCPQALTLKEYVLMNTGKESVRVSEEDFLADSVRAVSVDSHEVRPGMATKVFVVE